VGANVDTTIWQLLLWFSIFLSLIFAVKKLIAIDFLRCDLCGCAINSGFSISHNGKELKVLCPGCSSATGGIDKGGKEG
jgi:hypothetical protein